MARLLSWILMVTFLFVTRAQISPPGPLFIALNTVRTTNCSAPFGGTVLSWKVIFQNGESPPLTERSDFVWVTVTRMGDFSSLTINATNTSITSLECIGLVSTDPTDVWMARINVTAYDVPDPANSLSYIAYDDFIHTSWMLRTMEKISVVYYLSLLFYEPSQIKSQRVNVSEVQSYNLSIEGLRSCDYFTFCVRASNDAGLGNESCINGSLLYIPTEDYVDYSLSRDNGNFSLTVTVKVPATCLVNVQDSSYVLEVMGENDNRRSESVPADSVSYLQVKNLLANSSYMFRIESQSTNDRRFSMWIDFFTSDIQDINICSTNEGLFSVSCVYANGSSLTGCRFSLTGSNITEFDSKIMKDNTIMTNIPNFTKYENITIMDINGKVLFERDFNYQDIPRCSSTTVLSNSSTAPTTTDKSEAKSGTSTAIIVVIIVILGTALLLLGVTLGFIVYLHRKGYCSHKMNFISKEVTIGGRQTESSTQKLNGKTMTLTSNKTQDTEVATAGMYSSLERLHTPHGTHDNMKKLPETEYSQLSQEPLYHVLEKEPPLKSEDISADPDAPAVPPFCPSGGDTPPVSEVQQTTSTTADLMYAEIGNIRAKK